MVNQGVMNRPYILIIMSAIYEYISFYIVIVHWYTDFFGPFILFFDLQPIIFAIFSQKEKFLSSFYLHIYVQNSKSAQKTISQNMHLSNSTLIIFT